MKDALHSAWLALIDALDAWLTLAVSLAYLLLLLTHDAIEAARVWWRW